MLAPSGLQYSQLPTSTESDVEIGVTGTPTTEHASCVSATISCLSAAVSLALACVLLTICAGIFIFCCPCVCLAGRLLGRVVLLDGTNSLQVDDATVEEVKQARGAEFTLQLQSFISHAHPSPPVLLERSMSATVARTVDRAMSRLDLPPVRSMSSGMVRTVDRAMSRLNLSFLRTDSRTSVVSDLLETKRKRMLNLRLEMCSRPPKLLMVCIQREHILQQSLQCLVSVPSEDLLAARLIVDFKGGFGLDGGGLARDWFDSIGGNLFIAAEEGDGHMKVWPDKTIAPRPHEDRFMDLCSIGRLLGLAVWFEKPLPISLSSVICKFILNVPISPMDVQQLDPDFYQFRILPLCTEGGLAELEAALGEPLTFMSAATEHCESQELCPEGASKRVTEANKQDYIKLLCEYHLCGGSRKQINVLLKGFWDIFPQKILNEAELKHRELSLLISGFADLDVSDWRQHTSVSGNDNNPPEHSMLLDWFWEVVTALSSEDRAKLLHFITGSSRLPARGFAGLSPQLSVSIAGDISHLPHAHTCANILVVPPYTSKDILEDKLTIALSNDQGFGFM